MAGERVSLAMVALCVAAAAIGGRPAAAAPAPRQTGGFTFTSTVPGVSTGAVGDFEFQNPEQPGEKPHAVAAMIIRAPAGASIDTTVPPQCQASDMALRVEGPAGCPADTAVGSGLVVSDLGVGTRLTRYSGSAISAFNASGQIIGVAANNNIPALRFIDHTKIDGNTYTTTFPAVPGIPPPDRYTPIARLHIYFWPYARDGRAYRRTPPACPAAGYWTITATFVYEDGVAQTVESHSPCVRPAPVAAAPRRASTARRARHRRHRHAVPHRRRRVRYRRR
jgi:hypothetical protein